MNINNPAHPHHKVWREHVESVLADPENPKVVQWKDGDSWHDAQLWNHGFCHLSWDASSEYRMKPATVTRTLTYPKPLSEAPAIASFYWAVSSDSEIGVIRCEWYGAPTARRLLSRGMCFATEADALAAAKEIFGGGV